MPTTVPITNAQTNAFLQAADNAAALAALEAIGAAAAADIPAAETQSSILTKIGDGTRIGAEFMPEELIIESLLLGDTSADVRPDGALGGTGTPGEIAVHNNLDAGGLRFKLERNTITGAAVASSAEIQAGNVLKEIGRFFIEPSEIAEAMGSWYLLTGTLILQSATDSSLGAAPVVGIHVDGDPSTSVNRGIYKVGAVGASGFYSNRFDLYVPVLLNSVDADYYELKADTSKFVTHCWLSAYDSQLLVSNSAASFLSTTISTSGNVLKVNPAEIILSLRVTQDATFTGSVMLLASNVRLSRLA